MANQRAVDLVRQILRHNEIWMKTRGRKVVLDSSQLSDDDRWALIDLFRSHSNRTDQVVAY